MCSSSHILERLNVTRRDTRLYTDKKEYEIFLIYKEIIWDPLQKELPNMWGNAQLFNHLWICRSSYTVWLCNRSLLNFLIYEENLIAGYFTLVSGPLALPSMGLVWGGRAGFRMIRQFFFSSLVDFLQLNSVTVCVCVCVCLSAGRRVKTWDNKSKIKEERMWHQWLEGKSVCRYFEQSDHLSSIK